MYDFLFCPLTSTFVLSVFRPCCLFGQSVANMISVFCFLYFPGLSAHVIFVLPVFRPCRLFGPPVMYFFIRFFLSFLSFLLLLLLQMLGLVVALYLLFVACRVNATLGTTFAAALLALSLRVSVMS